MALLESGREHGAPGPTVRTTCGALVHKAFAPLFSYCAPNETFPVCECHRLPRHYSMHGRAWEIEGMPSDT